MIPYWIESTLAAMPAVLWTVLVLGLPYALVILPRKDWHDRAIVAGVALGIGPSLLTVAMFILGTWGGATQQALLTAPNIFALTAAIALVGVVWAWTKRKPLTPNLNPDSLAMSEQEAGNVGFHWDERLILLFVGVSLALIWLTTAYWPFIHYDPLWVYGYQGRLYALKGFIPTDIGYYPPLMSLQYAFGQLATARMLDDHAARAFIFPLHVGSLLMVYTLGRQLFTRRVGLIAAALWALYPHVPQWANVGDLEIPLTYGFTGGAAFFLAAWHADTRRARWHYGALGGLFLGIAMWTKPTAGAFIIGVVLLVLVDLLRVRLNLRAWYPRFEVAAVAGAASIPLGALWYVRNLYYGHEPITLPNEFWLTQSLRSGQELGWPILALMLLALFLTARRPRPNLLTLWGGLAVFVLSAAPTIITPRRMTAPEYLGLALGLVLMARALWPYYQRHASDSVRRTVTRLAWGLLLALPYFVNWFWNYSYHYRLSFAIVPLMILPSAVILAAWFTPERVRAWPSRRRVAYGLALTVLCVPGVVIPLYNYTGGWDWLWSDEFPDDMARLQSFNPALTRAVTLLRDAIDEDDIMHPVIVAPGLQRLPFFFPLEDVRIMDAPTDLDDLRGVDYYIYTQEARWYYEELGLPEVNQVTGSIGRGNVMPRIGAFGDTSFRGIASRVRTAESRFTLGDNFQPIADEVRFGDFAQLVGYRLTRADEASAPALVLTFEALKPAPADYHIYIHLRDSQGAPIATWDSAPAPNPYTHYPTTLWETGEYVIHRRTLDLPRGVTLDADAQYMLAVGFYALDEQHTRIETRVNGTLTDGLDIPYED